MVLHTLSAPPITGLVVRQAFTPIVNRYTIHRADSPGGEGPVIAAAQQKRLALNEQVTFYADEQRTEPVFGIKARDKLDLNTTFDFRTPDGDLVMVSERRQAARDVYDVELPELPDGSRIDWRVAASMAVALDAFQAR